MTNARFLADRLPSVYLVRGVYEDGAVTWYTGCSGASFVSPERGRAFAGFDMAGARRKASHLNAMTAAHGIRFVAVPEAA
jgi:hypothetical protein